MRELDLGLLGPIGEWFRGIVKTVYGKTSIFCLHRVYSLRLCEIFCVFCCDCCACLILWHYLLQRSNYFVTNNSSEFQPDKNTQQLSPLTKGLGHYAVKAFFLERHSTTLPWLIVP